MKTPLHLFILATCFIIPWTGIGQKPIDVIKAMSSAYEDLKFYSTDYEVETWESGQVTMHYSGKVRQGPDFYYSSLLGREVYLTKNHYVSVDHNLKEIIYSPVTDNQEFNKSRSENQTEISPEWLESLQNNIRESQVERGVMHIEFDLQDEIYKSMRLTIELTSFTLVELVYRFSGNSSDYVLIKYNSVSLNDPISPDLYSPENVLKVDSGELILNQEFQQYKITIS